MQPAQPDPKLIQRTEKVILAAMTLMYNEKTNRLLEEELKQKAPPEANAGRATARIMGLLFIQSQMQLDPNVLFSAGLFVLQEVIDYMEQTKRPVKDKEAAVGAYVAALMAMFKQRGGVAQQNPQQAPQPPAQAPARGGMIAQGMAA